MGEKFSLCCRFGFLLCSDDLCPEGIFISLIYKKTKTYQFWILK